MVMPCTARAAAHPRTAHRLASSRALPAIVEWNVGGDSRAARVRQKWYSALTLTWLPLLVLVFVPLVVLSIQPYSHSRPSS